MRLYMSLRNTHSTTIAAIKSGFGRTSGYRIEGDPRLPSQKEAPRGRRRADPLATLWDEEIAARTLPTAITHRKNAPPGLAVRRSGYALAPSGQPRPSPILIDATVPS